MDLFSLVGQEFFGMHSKRKNNWSLQTSFRGWHQNVGETNQITERLITV